jgi:predicted nucleic acid-binding protein
MIDKCLINTDVLIAAYTNADKERKEIARNLILKLYNEHKGCISIQNLEEFANITKSKLKIIDKDKLKEDLINIQNMFEIINYNPQTISDAFTLSFENNTNFYDALLMQTMLDNKITTIYSFDQKHFKSKGIKVINPTSLKKLIKK